MIRTSSQTQTYAVPSDSDTPEIKTAHFNIAKLKVKLFAEGGWGAVVLDYGQFNSNIQNLSNNSSLDAIVLHPYAKEIKSFWARNLGHFHIPGTPQDMLHMILWAVRSMAPKMGFNFLESQINRASKPDQIKLQPLIKNPLLLFIAMI